MNPLFLLFLISKAVIKNEPYTLVLYLYYKNIYIFYGSILLLVSIYVTFPYEESTYAILLLFKQKSNKFLL
jgi:hypothetical protein